MPSPGEMSRRAVPRPRRPTMIDVAREAGVALRTVSRVVNGDSTVGETFAERVRQAIVALDYQPDERARQLRSGITAPWARPSATFLTPTRSWGQPTKPPAPPG